MQYIYHLEKYDYISLYQNHLSDRIAQTITDNSYTGSTEEIMDNPMINEELTEVLIVKANELQNKKKLLLWDARYIQGKPLHYQEEIINLVSSSQYRAIIFLFDDLVLADLTRHKMEEASREKCVDINENRMCYYFGEIEDEKGISGYLDIHNIQLSINEEIGRYLFMQLKTQEEEVSPVLSSNVYANRFFSAKKILYSAATFNLIVYRMYMILVKETDVFLNGFDAFVCPSVNAACLSSALSVLIKKPVIFFRNVGPQMSVSDDLLIERVIENRRYIMVVDFLCLGTEYSRLKMLCNIRHAKVVGCLGISHYKLPMNSGSEIFRTLFSINEFDINYFKCFTEKDECKKSVDNAKRLKRKLTDQEDEYDKSCKMV